MAQFNISEYDILESKYIQKKIALFQKGYDLSRTPNQYIENFLDDLNTDLTNIQNKFPDQTRIF